LKRKSKRHPKRDCTVAPVIPTRELPNLMFKRDSLAKRVVREYVESQAPDEKVAHAERLATEYVLGLKYDGWDVQTDKARYWVIAPMMNLYSQKLFPSLDYAISFHIGLTARIRSEPDPGVERMEQALLPSAWRKWERAVEAMTEAEEAEDFQAVGMRCRESLVAMVNAAARPEMVPTGATAPKKADVVGWCSLIANHVAHGSSASEVRGYLKAVSSSGWALVNWVTHASSATSTDGSLAVELTQHIVSTFGTALFRHLRGIPDRCPTCGSYKIGLRGDPDHAGAEPVPGCRACGWIKAAAASPGP